MKEKIIAACIELFNEKGCKFTVEEVVARLKISKKTFYKYFLSKEDVMRVVMDEIHSNIQTTQRKIFEDESLSTRERLWKMLTIEIRYDSEINMHQTTQLKQFFPKIYDYLMQLYTTDWALVKIVLKRGMQEGIYRKVDAQLVCMLLQSGMQMLYQKDFAEDDQLTYQQELEQLVSIILGGIEKKE